MFGCVKRLAMELYAFDYSPTILVADSAKSITKGFKKVFNLLFRIDCWAHVDRNIDKNMLKLVSDKNTRESIKADIDAFQNNVETEYFETVARLMATKWKEKFVDQVDNFIKYFSKQWLSPKRMGWFDHYCLWTPVQNNALEGQIIMLRVLMELIVTD